MKTVRMTQDRNFPNHGMKHAGEVWENISDSLAAQLEQQGFARIESHVVGVDAEVKMPMRKRAREGSGQYKGDDPTTPEKNEAYE